MERIINGSHNSKDINNRYFEWWYFHFVSPELTANLVLHETDIFGLQNEPYRSLTILKKGEKPEYFKKKLKENEIVRGKQFLQTITDDIIENDSTIKLDLNFDNCHLQFNINKDNKPIQINNAILSKKGNLTSNWAVEVPFGSFSGTITTNGEINEVKGIAYQDHQWGNLRIQDFVSQWVWGHLSDDKSTVVFFHILTQDGEVIDRIIISSDGKTETYTNLTTNCLYDWQRNPTFYVDSYSLVVNLPNDVNLNIPIQPDSLMRSRILENHTNFIATYLRWAATSRNMLGIVEYLKIN